MVSVGLKTALQAVVVDDVLSAICYGSSSGACTSQSSSYHGKAESPSRITIILKPFIRFTLHSFLLEFMVLISQGVQHDLASYLVAISDVLEEKSH